MSLRIALIDPDHSIEFLVAGYVKDLAVEIQCFFFWRRDRTDIRGGEKTRALLPLDETLRIFNY